MENETEMLDSSNEQEVDDTSSDTDTQSEVDVEALQQKNRELFARAKRAEGFELKDGKWVKKEKPAPKVEEVKTETKEEKDLSGDDFYALMEAKVQKVDLPLVKQTAKALGLSISEALNHPVTKTVLQNAQEERKSAETANTGSTRKVNTKLNGESLLKKAYEGKLEDAEIGEAAKLTLNTMFK